MLKIAGRVTSTPRLGVKSVDDDDVHEWTKEELMGMFLAAMEMQFEHIKAMQYDPRRDGE